MFKVRVLEYTDKLDSKLSEIKALSGRDQTEWLFNLVQQTENNAFVCEVGTYYGRCSIAMAYACFGSNRRVITIDHMLGGFCDCEYKSRFNYIEVIDNMIKYNVYSKIIPFPMASWQAIELLKIWNPEISLVYLDGNHNEDNVLKE